MKNNIEKLFRQGSPSSCDQNYNSRDKKRLQMNNSQECIAVGIRLKKQEVNLYIMPKFLIIWLMCYVTFD
jgi:tRNA(Ile2) C34 agmatinyltransferase TiaS